MCCRFIGPSGPDLHVRPRGVQRVKFKVAGDPPVKNQRIGNKELSAVRIQIKVSGKRLRGNKTAWRRGGGGVAGAFIKSLLLSLVREELSLVMDGLECQPQPLELVRADVRCTPVLSDTKCDTPTTGGVTALPSDTLKSGWGKPRNWEEVIRCKIRELKVGEECFQNNNIQGVAG